MATATVTALVSEHGHSWASLVAEDASWDASETNKLVLQGQTIVATCDDGRGSTPGFARERQASLFVIVNER